MTGSTPTEPRTDSFQVEIGGQPFRVDSALYTALMQERKDMEEKYKGGDDEDDENMDALKEDLLYERARADSLEIELNTLQAGRTDSTEHSDAIAAEAESRLDAFHQAAPFLPKDTKFDGKIDSIGWMKQAIGAKFPDMKLDDVTSDYVRGTFAAMDSSSATPAQTEPRKDSTQTLRLDAANASQHPQAPGARKDMAYDAPNMGGHGERRKLTYSKR